MSITTFQKKFNNYTGNGSWVKPKIQFINRKNNGNEKREIPKIIIQPRFRSLEILELSNSRISGPIPTEIGNLVGLTTLDLHGNEITGTIPEEIGLLTKLERLLLQNNQLVGELPKNIDNLNNLNIFNISGNEIDVIYNIYTRRIIRNFNLFNDIQDKDNKIEAYIGAGYLSNLIRNEGLRAEIGEERIDNTLEKIKKNQSRLYPKIAGTLESGSNVFYVSAHGFISNTSMLIVPKNISIILTTTPTYETRTLCNQTLTINVNMDYLDYLLPGISYTPGSDKLIRLPKNSGKNQLRFFRSGDFIRDIGLVFMGVYPGVDDKYIYNSGIYNFSKKKNVPRSRRERDGTPKLNHHMNELGLEITNESVMLSDIIKKFKGRNSEHFVLIITSCLSYSQTNPFYSFLDHETIQNLSCTKGLMNMKQSRRTTRLQNLSSTYIESSDQPVCLEEIILRLKEIHNSTSDKDIQRRAINMRGFLRKNQSDYTPMEVRKVVDIIDRIRNPNLQKGGYVKIKNYGKRKIRYYKNGNPYVIVKGRKKKI